MLTRIGAAQARAPPLRDAPFTPPPSDVGFIGCAVRLFGGTAASSASRSRAARQARLANVSGDALPSVSMMWAPVVSPGARAVFSLRRGGAGDDGSDNGEDSAAHGARFQRVTHAGGDGTVGVANYGLNCQHGLFLRGAKPYEGFVTLRAKSDAADANAADAVTATVSLHDWVRNVTLAAQRVALRPGGGWQRVALSLTPSDDTTCGGALLHPAFRAYRQHANNTSRIPGRSHERRDAVRAAR